MSAADEKRFAEIGGFDQHRKNMRHPPYTATGEGVLQHAAVTDVPGFVNAMPGLTQEKLFAEMVESLYGMNKEYLERLAWHALAIASGDSDKQDVTPNDISVKVVGAAFYIHPTD